MPQFSNREEYLAWKAAQTGAGAAGSGDAAASQPGVQLAAPTFEAVKPKKGFGEAFSGLPPWAWIFIVGSAAIPVVSLGGAVPGALGFGAAAGCANLAKREKWSTGLRLLACAAVAGCAWLLFLTFAVGMAIMKQ